MNPSTKNKFRPAMESLEDRFLPAQTIFVLDFTPDYRSMGSLHETFYNVRLNDGTVPAFFDFDGDRQLTPNDVTVAANEITARVRGYYANYLNRNLTIMGGDVNPAQNQLFGDQWLRYGLKSKALTVDVLYFGGRSVGGEHGRAPLARDGYNVEGFGEVYVRTIAIDLWNSNPNATPSEFAINVASTAAHELGHMMGLRHASTGPTNNIMMSGRSRANNRFYDRWVYAETGPRQNAHHELWYSFGGQKSYYQYVNYGVPDAGHTHDHRHADEHDAHESAGLIELDGSAPTDFRLPLGLPSATPTAEAMLPALDVVFAAGTTPAAELAAPRATKPAPDARRASQAEAIAQLFANESRQKNTAAPASSGSLDDFTMFASLAAFGKVALPAGLQSSAAGR